MADRLTPAGLEYLRAVADKHVGNEDVPGLVALVASGDEVLAEPFGTLSIGGAPVQRDSLFRIASMTKPVTGAATMALIEEGLIGLDEPVDRLLPELTNRRVLRKMSGPLDDTVPAKRAITTRDLLTFTFGFGFVMEMFMASEPFPVVVASDAARLSTTGASVLGVLLARAAGQSFADVLRTRIFEPLGMSQTAFWASEPDRLATTYKPGPAGLEIWDPPDGKYARPPAFQDGAA